MKALGLFLYVMVILLASPSHAAMASGYDESLIDPSADPCEDFYQYACGTWLKNTATPKDRPVKSRGFSDVDERNKQVLKEIAERYARGEQKPKNPFYKQIGDIYSACQNEAQIEKSALKDFRSEVNSILKIKTMKQLPSLLASLHLKGVNALFSFAPDEDLKNPTEKIMTADQGGLGLPNREYYLSEKDDMKDLRAAYQAFAEAALLKAGFKDDAAKKNAVKVLELETDLSKSSLGPVERRNPEKLHNRLEREGLIKLAPSFNWIAYFSALGIPNIKTINVAVPQFFSSLDATEKGYSLEELKSYLIVRLFALSASAMDKSSLSDYFKFYSHLYGIKEMPPRTRRCLDEVGNNAGFALGRAFVDQTFSANAKVSVSNLVTLLKKEMNKKLSNIEWMDDETRKGALTKLDRQLVSVGYPDKWRNYKGLKTTRTSMLKNRLAAREFNMRYELSLVGKPVDRSEWKIAPMEVNATNMISQNAIYFPAGILQPPNYEEGRSDAANFGAIGTVIGHEITHGYDDQGRNFDERGAVRNWWSEDTGKEFEKRAQCIVDQFNGYDVAKDLHINGKLVTGEAIGDLGGMKLALAALHQQSKAQADSDAQKAEDRVFFLSIGQAWCSKGTEAFERFMTNSDPHPIDRFRVNGVVRNVPEFAKAFSCKMGAKLAPKNRCVVW